MLSDDQLRPSSALHSILLAAIRYDAAGEPGKSRAQLLRTVVQILELKKSSEKATQLQGLWFWAR